MWVEKGHYMEMYASAAALAADRAQLWDRVGILKVEIQELKDLLKAANARTEAAVDELLKLATLGRLAPIADETRQDQRKRADITGMDDMFEEEDAAKVAEWERRMAAGEDPTDLFEEMNT